MMTFGLNDAIGVWFKQVDLTHKLWTYLQVVGAAAVTYAWNSNAERTAIVVVLAAFVLFAIVNGVLVVTTQNEAYNTAQQIRSNWPSDHAWATLRDSFSSWRPAVVATAHGMIDVGVVILVSVQLPKG